MKVTALTNCNGYGYENFEAGETREVRKEVGGLLLSFGYAESAADEAPNKKEGKKVAETDKEPKTGNEQPQQPEEV